MTRILQATTRAEEYELRAKYLKDDYQLSGDGPASTAFRINKVLRMVPFSPGDKVLDISSGKGLLFELIHDKVSECRGHDVAPAMVERIRQKFKDAKNVSFTCGPSSDLPYDSGYFDKVLMTGAFCLQETREECMKTLSEIRRVAKDNAVIFLSDIAVVDESKLVPEHVPAVQRLMRRINQDGPVEFFASLRRYLFQRIRIARGTEPVLIPSDRGIWFDDAVFVRMCRENKLDAEGFPTEEITGTSRSRYDYLIKPVS
ncbi:MAG: class I SAM-dependent methyltransferase [Bacteroidetes bacterium]|nr:class I SAM-dependent methyltransferase [Bacteroidota bacterium]MCW5895022.1 class I SAM-dependent methyltransferase [Bacteroidota bacterium]